MDMDSKKATACNRYIPAINTYKDSDIVNGKATSNQMYPMGYDSLDDLKGLLLSHHFCLSSLRDGVRDIDHFTGTYYMLFDFDGGIISSEEIMIKLFRYMYISIESASDCGKPGRLRLILPARSSIDNIDTYELSVRSIINHFSLPIDLNICSPIQYSVKENAKFYFNNGHLYLPGENEACLRANALRQKKQKFKSDLQFSKWVEKYCGAVSFNYLTQELCWEHVCRMILEAKFADPHMSSVMIMSYLDSVAIYDPNPDGRFTRKKIEAKAERLLEI
jgi:hypothetical protein